MSNVLFSGINESPVIEDINPLPTKLTSSLVTESYDFIDLNYTGADLTEIIYKRGGASGTIVATVDITYLNGKINTVSKG